MSTDPAHLGELQRKYEALAADPEVNAICTWVQPNTSEAFDESVLTDGFESGLDAFFSLDSAASRLIKAKLI